MNTGIPEPVTAATRFLGVDASRRFLSTKYRTYFLGVIDDWINAGDVVTIAPSPAWEPDRTGLDVPEWE